MVLANNVKELRHLTRLNLRYVPDPSNVIIVLLEATNEVNGHLDAKEQARPSAFKRS